MSLLQVKNLTKDYGAGKGAFDISFALERGDIVGFIGPNGAGKSTTLNMCNGLLVPDNGEIYINETLTNWLKIHIFFPKVSVLLSEVAFDPRLRPIDIFEETLLLSSQHRDFTNAKDMAHHLELDIYKPFSELSLGNKKKVGIINCLLPDPEILILDEPTSGLDPLIQQKSLQLIQQIASKGGAVLLSSHVLSEVQSYCQRLMMIKEGHIVLESLTEDILDKMHKLFRFKNLPEALSKELHTTLQAERWIKNGDEQLLYTPDHSKVLPILARHHYTDFYLERPNLEEMFLEYYR